VYPRCAVGSGETRSRSNTSRSAVIDSYYIDLACSPWLRPGDLYPFETARSGAH